MNISRFLYLKYTGWSSLIKEESIIYSNDLSLAAKELSSTNYIKFHPNWLLLTLIYKLYNILAWEPCFR